ncbi:hypothetical protein [Baia soyae]|uniref:Uncharacterized protein n=1 Tax=Baia soyae TaxID=1544746 RepID=A0A4R2RXS9_9BACL|nr:hypothetical protein [Baia soyae]TCP68314.1 hypothetical protein EDD57_11853 [Baia soyae]
MYPNWDEFSRFAPVFFLWGAMISRFFIEFAVDKDFFNLYMILKWVWIIICGLWTIKYLKKYHHDQKYVRDVYIITIASICIYTLALSCETHFSFPSIIPYLFPFVIALLFVVAPIKLIKHIDKSK